MMITKWDPMRELEEMAAGLNRLLRGPLATRSSFGGEDEALVGFDWTPLVDVSETPREYLIKAELPEVKREDVKVAIEDGVLTIQGERRREKEEKDRKVHRVERAYGKFVRTFTVPKDVDEKKVAAEFRDGLLYVHVPRVEAAKPRHVDIKVA
jgi:HSP20 family protein